LLARKRAEPAHDGIHDGIHDGTGVEALRPPVARLGLVIAKKHVRRAVDRNRVKRQLRDSFRLHKQNLIGLDIVALARPGLGALDNTALRAMIDAQWTRLLKQQQKAGV
ncbi:MAG: ribonuclease P protein component, partial [Pseudomonadales bacterium]|nr:ribonuclease P protein component [Pseudomonadales bacterium]